MTYDPSSQTIFPSLHNQQGRNSHGEGRKAWRNMVWGGVGEEETCRRSIGKERQCLEMFAVDLEGRNELVFKQREHPGRPPEISPGKLGCLVCRGSVGDCVTGDRLWLTEESQAACSAGLSP